MGKISKIGWTHASWNPWKGCHKVSRGCRGCYADRLFVSKAKVFGHEFKQVTRSSDKVFRDPLNWAKDPEIERVFPCSLSDWFHVDADPWRDEAWGIVNVTRRLQYLSLTKRCEEIQGRLPTVEGREYLPPNFWLGFSAEDGKTLIDRWKIMQRYYHLFPDHIHWISLEPLVAPVLSEFRLICGINPPKWVVIGGESGNKSGKFKADVCELSWIQEVVDCCQELEIPIFVKQLGSVMARELGLPQAADQIEGFPEGLRVQDYPDYSHLLNFK